MNILLKLFFMTTLAIYAVCSRAEIIPHGVCQDNIPGYTSSVQIMNASVGDRVDMSNMSQFICKTDSTISALASLTCINKQKNSFTLKGWGCGPALHTEWVPSRDGTSYTCSLKQTVAARTPNLKNQQNKQQTPNDLIKIVKHQDKNTGKLEATNLGWHQGAYTCAQRTGSHTTVLYSTYFPVGAGIQIITPHHTCNIINDGKSLICEFPYYDQAEYGDLSLSMEVCQGNQWIDNGKPAPNRVFMCS